MKHYIIVKFIENYNYNEYINEIQNLFNESLKIKNIFKVNIFKSNSTLSNRYDIMIEMILTKEALIEFDNSNIHKEWKEKYGKYISNKTIFDCDIQ